MQPRTLVSNAIAKGKLVPQPCAVCGEIKVNAHHTDYGKPLDVVWLCDAHHGAEHTRLRKAGIKIPGKRGSTTMRVRLSDDTYSRIKKMAKADNRSLHNMVVWLIAKALN